jgi:hypothetical protein
MGNKLRRKPEAIIKSFEMDPEKKAVYVEGIEDRLFFEYAFEKQVKDGTLFFEIETVDLPEVAKGGNRQRLIEFAAQVESSDAKIKCFVDTDYTNICKKETIPKTAILTDFKDLEAYLYEKKYLNKFIKLGLKTNKITPQFILDEISNAREIAILRVCSQDKNFDFPFQKTNEHFSRYYKPTKGLNLNGYIQTLLQNSKIKPQKIELHTAINETKNKCKQIDNRHLIHGKDVIEIIKEISRILGYKKDNIELVFWMSFDNADINKFPALKKVAEFIK